MEKKRLVTNMPVQAQTARELEKALKFGERYSNGEHSLADIKTGFDEIDKLLSQGIPPDKISQVIANPYGRSTVDMMHNMLDVISGKHNDKKA